MAQYLQNIASAARRGGLLPSRPWREPLALLVLATVALPALAFCWGSRDGRLAFVLYREPKLAAFEVLGWTTVAACAWRARYRPGLSLAGLLTLPVPAVLVLLVGYMALGALWVAVPANLFYELRQYALLTLLLGCLVSWGAGGGGRRRWLAVGVVASFVPIILVGLLQRFVDIPLLPAIDPQYGVSNPSLMGYKNPMALALLGQIYLLAYLACEPASAGGAPRGLRLRRVGWGLLLALELAYLATLKSRASYLALGLSALLLLVLLPSLPAGSRRVGPGARRLALGVMAAGALFALLLAADAGTRRRAASLLPYLEDPGQYLESDRGTYLRNTLVMVRHHPFGVGLGDWQTHYPVFRRFHRETSFSDHFQVRRAHSDHVQMLGELGWQGLATWLALLAVAVVRPLRAYRRQGDRLALFTGVQIAAVAVAMAADYVVELPYNKLQLFLLLALATLSGPLPAPRAPRPRTPLAALALTLLAAAGIAYGLSCLLKSHASAALRELYRAEIEGAAAGQDGERARALAQIEATGRRFNRLPGHAKTFFRDHLLLAHAAWLQGEPACSDALARRSLELHPHYPNAFHLLAVTTRGRDPARAAAYAATYRHLMDQATEGFRRPYPPLPVGRCGAGAGSSRRVAFD